MENATFTILLGGGLAVTPRLRATLAQSRFIAADSGMRHARALGVTPELWVGDFDSTPDDLRREYDGVERRGFPPAKDATDGELAVEIAIARGARRLILAGAFSGERSDHALQHVLSALSLAERGFDVLLTSGEEEAMPLTPRESLLDLPAGAIFSVLGFTDLAGLHIAGARYPLENFALPFGSSRTLSNVAEGPVRLRLESGRALVLARPHDLTGA